MKALKRFLVLALALVMSLSLFACGDNGGENPGNGGENPGNGGENPGGETPTVSTCQAPDVLEYVFDNQVLENNKFSLNFKDKPTSVIFVEETDVEYAIESEVNGDKIDVLMESVMIGENKFFQFADSEELRFANITVTINPITKNYYNVDADTESAGYTIETVNKATNVKFNGAENVEGVTVGDDGINFAKSLFAGETMGHNKVEYLDNGVQYVVSVCAVTQKQLDNPITFEDGEISPFIGTFSAKAQAEVVDVFEDNVNADTAKMRYYINPDKTEVENRKQLAVESDTLVYIASYYLLARVEKLEQRTGFETWDNQNLYNLTAKMFNGTSNEHLYAFYMSEEGTHPTHTAYFGTWYNSGPNFSSIMSYEMYEETKSGKSSYIMVQVPRLKEGGLNRMYIDDIGATLDIDNSGNDADMWYGGNSSMKNQNPYKNTDAEYVDFRLAMDKVCLEG